MNQPVTFTHPSYLLMLEPQHVAMSTESGHLAIFTSEKVAERVAVTHRLKFGLNLYVQPVMIRPQTVEVMNDAAILDQVREHWMKVTALLVWKLSREGVTLSKEDIEAFPDDQVLVTIGNQEEMQFKIISREQAELLADHNESQTGHA
jgi:hypothetical protein